MLDGTALARSIAQECRGASDRLLALQDGLGGVLGARPTDQDLVTQLQALDTVQQTLEDLARMLTVLTEAGGTEADATVTEQGLAAIWQATLRSRMEHAFHDGKAERAATAARSNAEIELW